MKRLRLGAVLHFIIAIGHVGCLFALDKAFEAYGIKDIMYQIVSGPVWMLYALTICIIFAFCLVGFYALSATGDLQHLPLTHSYHYHNSTLQSSRLGWRYRMHTRFLLVKLYFIHYSCFYSMVLLARSFAM